MKRFIIKLSVIFCLVLKCVPAQTTAITPPTHDDQITMSLIVTDDHNHQVENISQADLQVIEDGKPLKVLGLERDLRPVMYTIAIDVSGSFQTSIRRSLQLARGFIENNRPEDETMLVSFVG